MNIAAFMPALQWSSRARCVFSMHWAVFRLLLDWRN